jgi:hypothetical protein
MGKVSHDASQLGAQISRPMGCERPDAGSPAIQPWGAFRPLEIIALDHQELMR